MADEIDQLAPKFEVQRSESSFWTILAACATTFFGVTALVGVVGKLVIDPITEQIIEIKQDLREIRVTMAPLLTLYAQHKSDDERFLSLQTQIDTKQDKTVFDASYKSLAERIASLVITDDKSRDEILGQLHRLEDTIVTRQENAVHWGQTDALVLRVNALADKVSDRYCPMTAPAPKTAL